MKEHLLLNEVAKELGIKPYQIAYRLTCGEIPEPESRFNNHRVFTRKDVDQIRKYFAGKQAMKEAHAR